MSVNIIKYLLWKKGRFLRDPSLFIDGTAKCLSDEEVSYIARILTALLIRFWVWKVTKYNTKISSEKKTQFQKSVVCLLNTSYMIRVFLLILGCNKMNMIVFVTHWKYHHLQYCIYLRLAKIYPESGWVTHNSSLMRNFLRILFTKREYYFRLTFKLIFNWFIKYIYTPLFFSSIAESYKYQNFVSESLLS